MSKHNQAVVKKVWMGEKDIACKIYGVINVLYSILCLTQMLGLVLSITLQ